jgi:Methyltransferase FkbM domain
MARNEPAYNVHMDTLENIILGPVDFIKIDVEGYEYFALQGAMRILRKQRPILFVEVHPVELGAMGLAAATVIEKLKEIYSDIAFFRPRPDRSLPQKIARRYFRFNQVSRIADLDGFISEADTGRYSNPFWVVCK